jgi:hypothetical protein
MGIAYYLHIKSKESLADCLTKHLTHVPLWNLVKDCLFHWFKENDEVNVMHVLLLNDTYPDGECQAGNGFSQEHDVGIYDNGWCPFLISNDYHLVQKCLVDQPTRAQIVFWSKMTRGL